VVESAIPLGPGRAVTKVKVRNERMARMTVWRRILVDCRWCVKVIATF